MMIAAKQAKLKGDNESMGKLYRGFSIERPYQLIFTKAVIATPLSNEEFTKLSAAKDFKAENILALGDKKFQIRNTVSGQAEVETFGLSLKRITDAKAQLQQLVDLQPRLTKDDDKTKVEKAIKELQDDLSKNLEEFRRVPRFRLQRRGHHAPGRSQALRPDHRRREEGHRSQERPAAPAAGEKK
jgi:hypothetical protein